MGSECDGSLALLVWLEVGWGGYVSHGYSSMLKYISLFALSSQQASWSVSRPY